jgi:Protein of unknown function (DUF2809)
MTPPRFGAALRYFGVAMLMIATGLALRLVALGLPSSVVKWGGSVLWAAMVYWIVAGLLPHCRIRMVAAASSGIAALVEVSRLYHSPGLDAFRLSLAGKLLLGRVFAWQHIAVYTATILVTAWLDRRWVRR